MRIRISTSLAWLTFVLMCFPIKAFAGGAEFPGEGTRGLGRGGAIMTRPDDPYIMARNPALLADLWGSQLYINTLIGMPNSCVQPTGGWGWGYETDQVISTGKGEPGLYSKAQEGSMGGPSKGEMVNSQPYIGEPYPKICYSEGATLIPSVILTTHLNDKIGIGIGFMPPELSQQNGFGETNGVVNTKYGPRPSPMRYLEPDYQDNTYFGLLGAIGYRVLPWLRIGAGFRWTMIMDNTRVYQNRGNGADPALDMRADFYSQDLFIPGMTASIQIVPIDSLDIAAGFRWDDHLRMNDGKIDLNSGPYSYYSNAHDIYLYKKPGATEAKPIDSVTHEILYNYPGSITVEPITPMQISGGIRYADRIRPRPDKYVGLLKAKDPIHDPMADENWDIELDAVLYMNADNVGQGFVTDSSIPAPYKVESATGQNGNYNVSLNPGTFPGGMCIPNEKNCKKYIAAPRDIHGWDQISLRLGGDYNVLPNVLALRLGVSYESRGQDPEFVRPTFTMPFERVGIHGGATWRVDGRTDISIGYAHFFQETISLAVNTSQSGEGAVGSGFPASFAIGPNGTTLTQDEINKKYHVVPEDKADGKARIPIYAGTYEKNPGQPPGKYFANAGTFKFALDVVSISIMRHF
jgi:hypothetical protein